MQYLQSEINDVLRTCYFPRPAYVGGSDHNWCISFCYVGNKVFIQYVYDYTVERSVVVRGRVRLVVG